jgi:hypothetical protein
MRLRITIELPDRCRIEPLPVVLGNRSIKDPLPSRNGPLAGFVAQLVATYLGLPQTRARRRRAQAEVSGSYVTSYLSLPERPTLDRLV